MRGRKPSGSGAPKKNRTKVNEIKTAFPAKSVNEALSRMVVSALVCQLDPTLDELADVKTAVSEAVTNCIVHGYKNSSAGIITLWACYFDDGTVRVTVKDKGSGIEDLKRAMEPLFTTDESGERSGMGFPIMQSFMDKIKVISKPGRGTTVIFSKKINKG